jgi:hypothetical protein
MLQSPPKDSASDSSSEIDDKPIRTVKKQKITQSASVKKIKSSNNSSFKIVINICGDYVDISPFICVCCLFVFCIDI